mmetsp:Transcript_7905/g.19630  ORF Transcript_7905/g.19630 Transcript_7905/m.19630 type:complete len:591 (+) Transcript_7905:114-1886(+)
MNSTETAAERKRKRLEAWRKRAAASNTSSAPAPAPVPVPVPAIKISMSLNSKATKKLKSDKNKKRASGSSKSDRLSSRPLNPFGAVDDDEDGDFDGDDSDVEERSKQTKKMGLGFMTFSESGTEVNAGKTPSEGQKPTEPPTKRRRKGRWDSSGAKSESAVSLRKEGKTTKEAEKAMGDALDKFMDKLEAGALGSVAIQVGASAEGTGTEMLSIDVGGSMMRVPKLFPNKHPQPSPVSGGFITPDQIAKLSTKTTKLSKTKQANPQALYTPSDWESGAGTADEADETDDDKSTTANDTKDLEDEEKARRAFIEALKSATGQTDDAKDAEDDNENQPVLASEVKNEKTRREQRFKDLEREAETARSMAEKAGAPEIGRLYNDVEGGVMEEAERNLDAAMAAPDALQVLAELNKKKELKSVDHSAVDYIPFKKNLYIVPRALAKLNNDEVANLRGKLKVKVRGRGAPAPVSSFEQCGMSERIMRVMEKQGIRKPFPVQAQCLPCIMAGRDVIGVAKTGSGKTLSYLLPMLRHITDQPPLEPYESGPIGLVLAPARELAYQIHLVCKSFTKPLGLKKNALNKGFQRLCSDRYW